MVNRISINYPSLAILLIIICTSCISKKKVGAHFQVPSKVKQTEFHKLKPEHRVIIKGFRDFQVPDSAKIEGYDSIEKVTKKEEVKFDSASISNNSQGRFFISRTHQIIPPDDPRLEKLPKPKRRKTAREDKKKRRRTEEPFGALSLLLLPVIFYAAKFSLIAGGVFFIAGGILSIIGFFKTRNHSHRLKGIGWTHASMTLYGLILAGLMFLGLAQLFVAWLII